MSQQEVKRLAGLASKYRQRSVELEQMFTTYTGNAIKRLLAARSAKPQEYLSFEEKNKIAKTRGELLETFVQFDTECKNAMSYDEFKNAMLLKGFMADENSIKKTFHGMDKDHNAEISQREFLAGVIGKLHTEEFSFKSQIDFLTNEVKEVELKHAEDSDYIEKLLLENEMIRSQLEEGAGNEELQAENERLKELVSKLTSTRSDMVAQEKAELEREILRLREFGTHMRNQLNLIQREAVVGARTAAKKIIAMSGATEAELDQFDRETEASQLIAQVRQVFINLDDQHMGDMDFEKFTQAHQWLSLNSTVGDLQKAFARKDTKQSGLITEDDFLGVVIQDLDVNQFTTKSQFDSLMEKMHEFDDRISDLLGTDVSQKLRDRINQMKHDMNDKMGGIFKTMGMNVADVISPEVLEKHLKNAFDKFDHSRDGRLNYKEFGDAWRELGLKGSGEELRAAFDEVDTDKSGLVDFHEFNSAISENRLTELNVNVLLEAMGVQLGSMSDRYAAFSSTQSRRRGQRKTMEATLAERCSLCVESLCKLTGRQRDAQKAALNQEFRETFERFDRNGSGELNIEEYTQAWRFLKREGSDKDIKEAFESVDIDNSGFIEFDEFIFSLQGEEAQKYGLIADMELMIQLLTDVSTDIMELRGERTDGQKSLTSLKDRMQQLQGEVQNRTEGLVVRMQRASGNGSGIDVNDLEAQLRDSFDKADSNRSGTLNVWQFSQSWMALGLAGSEDEIKDLYNSGERLGSRGQGMDYRQFCRVVKGERMPELVVRARLSSLEYLFGLIEGGYAGGSTSGARRRLARMKQDEEMSVLLYGMIEAVLPATDDVLSPSYKAKQERFKTLRDSFHRFDSQQQGAVNLSQYMEARRYAGFAGSDSDLEKAYRNVDTDGSGMVDFYEFVFSEMGKKGQRVGAYGYTKILNKLLGSAVDRFKSGSHTEAPKAGKNKIRLNARKLVQGMTGFGGVDQRKLESLGIHIDNRAHSITMPMLEHILLDRP